MRRIAPTALLLALAAVLSGSSAAPAGAAPSDLVAPATACPGAADPTAGAPTQLRAMRCLVGWARERRGRAPLRRSAALERAARGKAGDILRCDEFSHEACGRPFSYWFERVSYRGRCTAYGENIAWGTGRLGSAREIFRAWIDSPGHRANILGPYAELGLGLRRGGLEGNRGARVWVQEFGSRRC